MIKSTGLKRQERCKSAKNCWGSVKVGRSGILKVSTARGRNRWTWQTPTFEQTPLALCLDNNLLKQFFQTFYTIITALKILDLAMILPVRILLCVLHFTLVGLLTRGFLSELLRGNYPIPIFSVPSRDQ